jgi:molecular chaperone DnaK (HSP70)
LNLDDRRYIIGIDLGTTNSAVAYVDLQVQEGDRKRVKVFPMPQMTGPGEVSRLAVLPSFLYIPGDYDIGRESLSPEWSGDDQTFAGAFARDHGAKVPARLVSSAKSWLCHAKADRKAPILPWGSTAEVQKLSPVQATAAYLKHIRRAWNQAHRQEEAWLQDQVVIITVPASFDEVARELTLEAAAMAGMGSVILLEEPLAAFYSWLMAHEKQWPQFIKPNELVLVCDVGGGTTDFTLIYLRQVEAGSPRFERIAVGDHLILGGDNIDLALARQIELQFSHKQRSVGGDRWKNLCHQCRQAKEALLDGQADSRKITLMGTGSRLIAGTLAATLEREEVIRTVLEGFFPLAAPGPSPSQAPRKGITEFGLPYEQEPAVTRHLGWFLEQHRKDVAHLLQKARPEPDVILFNGGSLKPAVIQERIRSAVRHWFGQPDEQLPRVLANPDLDLAVALGAAYYGLVKLGQGVRVGSGSPRAYYLGVAKKSQAVSLAQTDQALCIVERGLEEGSDIQLQAGNFEVRANQPVSFDLYSSSYRSGDRCGDLVNVDDTLTALPPIQTVIQYGKKGVQTQIPIHIAARYTELGTLALWCQSLISNHRWQLQFHLRSPAPAAEVADQEIFDAAVVDGVRSLVRTVFEDRGAGDRLAALAREVADQIDRKREHWPLSLIRSMADELLELESVRAYSPRHESRWLNLAGFCMRPGFADGGDPLRMKKIWQLFLAGPRHANQPQVLNEWWILWRRVAGGLTAGQQRQLLQSLAPTLFGAKGKGGRKVTPQQRLEVWMAVANLEHLLAKDKIKCARGLLAEIQPKTCRPQHFWALSRLGARELLYGSVDRVIGPKEVTGWIEILLSTAWCDPKPVGLALAQLGRKTGDRARDLEPAVADKIMAWMTADSEKEALFAPHLACLQQVVPLARQEESAIFGETLPAGLVLHA